MGQTHAFITVLAALGAVREWVAGQGRTTLGSSPQHSCSISTSAPLWSNISRGDDTVKRYDVSHIPLSRVYMSNNRVRRKSGLNKVWADGKRANVVGLMIRKMRRKFGLTQEQLAAQCQVRGLNLSRGTLAKIEAGVRFVKACELFIIAKVLKMPMEHFYPEGFGRSRSG